MGERRLSAADFLPPGHTLEALRSAARGCRGCELFRGATQTVFGDGSPRPRLVLIGEVPGDQEDRIGRPFVGAAGAVLDRALAEAGMPRNEAYVTNAVKHFSWEPRGKRRLHKRPTQGQIEACRPWLVAEIAALRPAVVVCLGVTAARSVFHRNVSLHDYRGRLQPSPLAAKTFVTVHPSAILRLPESAQRHAEYGRFVADLERLRDLVFSVDNART